MVFCDVTFRKAVTLVLLHGHCVDEGGSFGDAVGGIEKDDTDK